MVLYLRTCVSYISFDTTDFCQSLASWFAKNIKKLAWDCSEACWKASCDLMTRRPPGGKLRAPYSIRVPMTQGGQSIYNETNIFVGVGVGQTQPSLQRTNQRMPKIDLESRNYQPPLWGWHNDCLVAMAHASFLGATAALWAKSIIHERAQLTFRLLW